MTYYTRNLPHWHPEGASIFLTWRLYGSLPVEVRRVGNCGATPVEIPTARNGCATNGCATKHFATRDSAGRRFKLMDAALDRSTSGPLWLKIPRVASTIVALIDKGDSVLGYFSLHSFVVMPNHIHLLITPKVTIARIMNGLKGATARAANQILHLEGKHFWQDESFDHWIRTPFEFDRIRTYIEFNPVKAGLTGKPENWPWSSAGKRRK